MASKLTFDNFSVRIMLASFDLVVGRRVDFKTKLFGLIVDLPHIHILQRYDPFRLLVL